MPIRTLLIVVAFLAAAQPQSVNIPETPAGHMLKAWLDAFNSGDRATEEKYLKTYDPERSLDDEMRFRGMTGGFILTPSRSEHGAEPIAVDFSGLGAREIMDFQHANGPNQHAKSDFAVADQRVVVATRRRHDCRAKLGDSELVGDAEYGGLLDTRE